MTESALSLDEKSDINKTNREENNNTTIKITANLNLVLLFSNIDRLKKG
jgi:uridine kinase|tara:strand:- start:433 stop:579 length:147 start_codon:yes stop_codon:yes gene_type:complete